MYVSEICAEGIFVTFSCWLKYVKSRSKITIFSNERHSEIWFPKKKTITFFWSKLSKLHKKDPILHVTTTFPLKQGETSVPIPHPLSGCCHIEFGSTYLCVVTNVEPSTTSHWVKKGKNRPFSEKMDKWTIQEQTFLL